MSRQKTPPTYWCRRCSHAVAEHQAHGCKHRDCACPRTEAETGQPVPVQPQGLGSHQRKHKAGYAPPATPTPAGTMATCPDCGHEVKAMGLGTHRRQKHGRGRATTLVKPPPPPAKNGHPSRREKYLCSRCPAEFLSREERDAHQAAHPEIPPAPVVRRAGAGANAGYGE